MRDHDQKQRSIVIACLEAEGFHNYPSAPREVEFLRARHRHTFVVRCAFPVSGLDREKEIFMEQWRVQSWLEQTYGKPCEFGAMSCEMIALELVKQFGLEWAEVLEDGKGGAKVYSR